MSERTAQVNQLIKQEVGIYLQEHLSGHSGFLTVTAVETTPDLKSATVWYGYVGEDLARANREVKRAGRALQSHINKRLAMKSVPRIVLKYDKSGEYASDISRVIDEANSTAGGDSRTS